MPVLANKLSIVITSIIILDIVIKMHTKRKRGQLASSTFSEVLGITYVILNE